jgi:hypothetical protein
MKHIFKNSLHIFYLIILLVLTIYLFILTRKSGCTDPKALNYNKHLNVFDYTKCIYPNKGCMDSNSINFNKFATISCKEDCDIWKNGLNKYITNNDGSIDDVVLWIDNIDAEILLLSNNYYLVLNGATTSSQSFINKINDLCFKILNSFFLEKNKNIYLRRNNKIYYSKLEYHDKIFLSLVSLNQIPTSDFMKSSERIDIGISKFDYYCYYNLPCTIKNLKSFQSRFCKECICLKNIKGCTRGWCVNYNNKATIDTTDISDILSSSNNTDFTDEYGCIATWDLLRRIQILCSSNCNVCTNKVIIKIDDKYILNTNDDGVFVLIIKKNVYLNKFVLKKFIPIDEISNTELYNYLTEQIKDITNNILIFIVKNTNGKININFKTLQFAQNKMDAKNMNISQGSSYLLIFSDKPDSYFELLSEINEIIYPDIQTFALGCFNINQSQNILDSNKYYMISNKNYNVNPYQLVNRCALETSSQKKKYFTIKDNNCYVLNNNKNDYINQLNLLGSSTNCQYKLGIGNGESNTNNYMLYYVGSNNYEIYDLKKSNNYVSFYTLKNFADTPGVKLRPGIYNFNKLSNTLNSIASIRVPKGLLVNIFDTQNNKLISILGNNIDSDQKGTSTIPNLSNYLASIQSDTRSSLSKSIDAQISTYQKNNEEIDLELKKIKKEIDELNKLKSETSNDDTLNSINFQLKKINQEELDKSNSKKANLNYISELNNKRENIFKQNTFYKIGINDKIFITDVTNSIVIFSNSSFKGTGLPFPLGNYNIPDIYQKSNFSAQSIYIKKNNNRILSLTLYKEVNQKEELDFIINPISNIEDNKLEIYGSTIPIKSVSVQYLISNQIFYTKTAAGEISNNTFIFKPIINSFLLKNNDTIFFKVDKSNDLQEAIVTNAEQLIYNGSINFKSKNGTIDIKNKNVTIIYKGVYNVSLEKRQFGGDAIISNISININRCIIYFYFTSNFTDKDAKPDGYLYNDSISNQKKNIDYFIQNEKKQKMLFSDVKYKLKGLNIIHGKTDDFNKIRI